jgi:transcriptional regulator GlxA family with amidase domain
MEVIPVFILVPPDTLLIDVAGPLEVLRYANGEQDRVRFDYRYISANTRQQTSIGLVLDGLEPLPETLPENAILMISGSLTVGIQEIGRDSELKTLTRWLSRAVRPDTRLVTICSGALLAAAAGLMEGYQCTSHEKNAWMS